MSDKNLIDLPEGKVAYCNLAKPRAWTSGDDPKYDVTIAWPVSAYRDNTFSWREVKTKIHQVAVDAWGDRAAVKRDGGAPYKVPFRYGEDAERNPEQFADFVLGTFRSKFEIPVVRLTESGEPEVFPAEDVQRGMLVRLCVKPKSWVGNGRGIALYPFALAVVDPEPDVEFNERTAGSGDGSGAALAHFKGAKAAAPTATKRRVAEQAEDEGTAARPAPDAEAVLNTEDIPF